MPHVESSAVTDVDYDPQARRLLVRFVSGAAYAYSDVPPAISRAFMAADSKGRYFARRIRDHFPYKKIA